MLLAFATQPSPKGLKTSIRHASSPAQMRYSVGCLLQHSFGAQQARACSSATGSSYCSKAAECSDAAHCGISTDTHYCKSFASTASKVNASAPSRTSRTYSIRTQIDLKLTLATSAVCWKCERDEACKVIRSIGDPDGAQLISSRG